MTYYQEGYDLYERTPGTNYLQAAIATLPNEAQGEFVDGYLASALDTAFDSLKAKVLALPVEQRGKALGVLGERLEQFAQTGL